MSSQGISSSSLYLNVMNVCGVKFDFILILINLNTNMSMFCWRLLLYSFSEETVLVNLQFVDFAAFAFIAVGHVRHDRCWMCCCRRIFLSVSHRSVFWSKQKKLITFWNCWIKSGGIPKRASIEVSIYSHLFFLFLRLLIAVSECCRFTDWSAIVFCD